MTWVLHEEADIEVLPDLAVTLFHAVRPLNGGQRIYSKTLDTFRTSKVEGVIHELNLPSLTTMETVDCMAGKMHLLLLLLSQNEFM